MNVASYHHFLSATSGKVLPRIKSSHHFIGFFGTTVVQSIRCSKKIWIVCFYAFRVDWIQSNLKKKMQIPSLPGHKTFFFFKKKWKLFDFLDIILTFFELPSLLNDLDELIVLVDTLSAHAMHNIFKHEIKFCSGLRFSRQWIHVMIQRFANH